MFLAFLYLIAFRNDVAFFTYLLMNLIFISYFSQYKGSLIFNFI